MKYNDKERNPLTSETQNFGRFDTNNYPPVLNVICCWGLMLVLSYMMYDALIKCNYGMNTDLFYSKTFALGIFIIFLSFWMYKKGYLLGNKKSTKVQRLLTLIALSLMCVACAFPILTVIIVGYIVGD